MKIIDFGLSQRIRGGNYIFDTVGTLEYLAPEVARKQFDEKADIWSLGVILYQLLLVLSQLPLRMCSMTATLGVGVLDIPARKTALTPPSLARECNIQIYHASVRVQPVRVLGHLQLAVDCESKHTRHGMNFDMYLFRGISAEDSSQWDIDGVSRRFPATVQVLENHVIIWLQARCDVHTS